VAPYVPSPFSVIRKMLILAELKPREVLFDLGSGDGRVLIMAAEDFGAHAVGVELREDLAKKSLISIHNQKLQSMVTIYNRNLFSIDLSRADVIFLYLTTGANEKIKPKLEMELKVGGRVVSHDYGIVGWQPSETEKFCENPNLGYPSHTLYLYKG